MSRLKVELISGQSELRHIGPESLGSSGQESVVISSFHAPIHPRSRRYSLFCIACSAAIPEDSAIAATLQRRAGGPIELSPIALVQAISLCPDCLFHEIPSSY